MFIFFITFANASKIKHLNRPFDEEYATHPDADRHHIHTGIHRSGAMRKG